MRWQRGANETTADVGVEGALAAYASAIDQGRKADTRLFVTLARSSSEGLAAR